MSRGVGYIAGVELADLQAQWGTLLDQNVDVILFDRLVLKPPGKPDASASEEAGDDAIWRWAQTMVAGQDVVGNHDRYVFISDLQPGDVLVLARLDVLFHAYPGAWPEFMQAHMRGVDLAILESSFHSAGSYGDVVIKKMDTMFKLGAKFGCSS